MKRGPKPKPKRIKELEGNPGKRPLPNEPVFNDADLEPPGYLSGMAKDKYALLAKELQAVGLLKKVSSDVLASYCTAVANYAQATEELGKTGLVIINRNKDVTLNPYLKIQRVAIEQMRKLAGEFGFTPGSASQINLKVDQKGDGERSDLKIFLEEA